MALLNSRNAALAGVTLAALISMAMVHATAQQGAAPPNFSPDPLSGWVPVGDAADGFTPIPGRVPPLSDDPAHPYVANNNREGRQPTDRIADLSNPNLKPWARAAMKKDIDEILAGKLAFTPRSSCYPPGVPSFMAYGGGGGNPTYIWQTPKEVWMLFTGGQEVRRIYLDVPHTANPKPSWYGESVGHYEGDTLVVDTIGQTTRTFVDPLRTPHGEKLHVTERWRLADEGRALVVAVTVEDPDTYYQAWSGLRRYRPVKEAFFEHICAENNQQLVNWHIPVANKPDF
jgi:hypothetical protein